ncbi:MAG: ribonuclease J [Caldiserica bacterium]|nr:MAG: ribonuclease J [Caldisericota bacterium]
MTNSKDYCKENPVKITFLGGLGEIGKNMTVFEDRDSAFILDAGFKFPEAEMYGVEQVIPDMGYIETIKDKLKGLVLTHAHLDHIGAIKFVFEKIKLPLFGTKLTLGLASTVIPGRYKPYEEHEIKPGERFNVGTFQLEAVYVNHSIPDGVGFIIKRKGCGTIFHTGDFKIDATPIDGRAIDLQRIGMLGREGVLLLLSDSTNATRDGLTGSERIVGENLERLFRKIKGRIIITTFSTNIHRIQQIFDISWKLKKKVHVDGKSFVNIISVAKKLGYLNIPDGLTVDINELPLIPDENLVILTTGSQGEPLSGLTRLSSSTHQRLRILPGDTVIISAHPIPGNEEFVNRTVNNLFSLGADVIYREEEGIHVSGHASGDELKIMLQLTKPKFFVPVHGETRHLFAHRKIALDVGVEDKNVFILENGDSLIVYDDKVRRGKREISGELFIDGLGFEREESEVLKDRRFLAKEGIVAVALIVKKGRLKDIKFASRGFFAEEELKPILQSAKDRILTIFYENHNYSKDILERDINGALSSLFYKKTRRRPMILTLIFREE